MPLAKELAKGGIKLLKNAKPAAKAEKARDARWAMEKEARIRQERAEAQRNSKELWKYKEAEAAKKETKARRIATVKNVAKGTGKATAGAAVGFGVMETATEGNLSKEMFGRKDKPTKASPRTRRGGKPMKGTK